MVISITSLKGGVGKSTLSQNLAVCFTQMGYRTAIVDADVNNSCEHWSGIRAESLPPITVFSISDAKALQKNIKQYEQDYEVIIIDGTPSMSRLVSTILLVGDVILIPIRPSGLDIWATEKFLEKYEQAKTLKEEINAHFVLNMYDPRLTFSKESKDVLNELEIPLLKTTIKNRQAYIEAVVRGEGVYEYSDRKAKSEIIQLTNEVLALVQFEMNQAG